MLRLPLLHLPRACAACCLQRPAQAPRLQAQPGPHLHPRRPTGVRPPRQLRGLCRPAEGPSRRRGGRPRGRAPRQLSRHRRAVRLREQRPLPARPTDCPRVLGAGWLLLWQGWPPAIEPACLSPPAGARLRQPADDRGGGRAAAPAAGQAGRRRQWRRLHQPAPPRPRHGCRRCHPAAGRRQGAAAGAAARQVAPPGRHVGLPELARHQPLRRQPGRTRRPGCGAGRARLHSSQRRRLQLPALRAVQPDARPLGARAAMLASTACCLLPGPATPPAGWPANHC
jgi:hypothetical protein